MAQDAFTDAYIVCALWSSTDEGGKPLDCGDNELAPATVAEMEQDCADFQEANGELLSAWYDLGETDERAGHDFWLTRNGHGAGFWDRFSSGNPAILGHDLSAAAKCYGSRELYIGDDGLIYQV